MGRKFGWHSGVLTCQDAKIQGDCYIQDDLVFSDVSAGTLGVTGGIDMDSTTSTVGISMGGTYSTAAIEIDTTNTTGIGINITGTGLGIGIAIGSSGTPLSFTNTEHAIDIYTTCASTSGSATAMPVYINASYTGTGQVGRALEAVLAPTGQMGGWCNAIKGYTDFSTTATTGGSTGLASAVCAEIRLPNGACSGAFFPLEVEWVGQTSTAFGTPGSGSSSGFMYLKSNGTRSDFDSDGVFMSVGGLTAGAGKLLSVNSQTLKCDIGWGTTRYLMLSQAEDSLSLDTCATAITIGDNVTTVGIQIGDVPIGISLDGDFTDAIKIAGSNTIVDGIEIASDCTYGLNVSGTCSTAGILLSTTNKISFHDAGMYMRSSADGHLEIVSDDTITLSVAGSGSGGIVFGGETDWGTGATGPDLDGTGWDWVTQTVGRVNTENVTAAAYASQYNALTLTKSQNLTSSFFGTWTELYLSASVDLTGASNVAAVWGQIETGATVTGPDQSDGDFMAAGYFNFKTGASFTTGSYVDGVRIQSEVSDSSYTLTGSTWMAGLEILTKSGSYQNWTYGVKISGSDTGIDIGTCTTGMSLSGVMTTMISMTHDTAATTALLQPAVNIAWDCDDIYGDDGDRALGSGSTMMGCLQIGSRATPTTIKNKGSHMAILIEQNLTGETGALNATGDIAGGIYNVLTVDTTAQTTGMIAPITNYLRIYDSTGILHPTGNFIVNRNICYIGTNDEAFNISVGHFALIDAADTHGTELAQAGVEITMNILTAKTNNGDIDAVRISSVGTTTIDSGIFFETEKITNAFRFGAQTNGANGVAVDLTGGCATNDNTDYSANAEVGVIRVNVNGESGYIQLYAAS